jgi:TPR repeat protein
MSFILTVWAQPVNTPLPTTVMQAHAQMEQMQNATGEHVEPRFLALARALEARFPHTEDGEDDMFDHGLSILEQNPDTDQTYNIALLPRDDRFDLGYQHLVNQANRLGLHVLDEQNGFVHLVGGQMLRLNDPVAAQAAPPAVQPRVATQLIDARTREYAKILALDHKLIARAEADHADSQYALAAHLLNSKNIPVRTQVELVVLWLERAVAQGHTTAQAKLGQMLIRGWGGLPVNPERGTTLLEASASANDPYGLVELAALLYQRSIFRTPENTMEKRSDAASLQDHARIPQLLVRAVAQNDPRAFFWLAARMWSRIGTAPDDIAAKALMVLAKSRDPECCAQNPQLIAFMEIKPTETAQVMALAKHWGTNLPQLPTLLAERHARMSAENRQAEVAQKLAEEEQVKEGIEGLSDSNYSFPPWHIGKTALVIGAVWFLLQVAMFRTLGPTGFKVTALLLGAVGAFGVWRTSEDFDWNGAVRFLVAALALVPGLGVLVCIGVLWRSMK